MARQQVLPQPFERVDYRPAGWTIRTMGQWCRDNGVMQLTGWTRVFDDLGNLVWAECAHERTEAELWELHDGVKAALDDGHLPALQATGDRRQATGR